MIYLSIIIAIIKYKIIPIMSNTENKKKTDLKDLKKKEKKKQPANPEIHLIRIKNKNCFNKLQKIA